MANDAVKNEVNKRRTFAIISHPDAGKTTVTEQLLLYGGAIQLAGTVKARKAARHATSDWMQMEKERGISISSAVMQFIYQGKIINLLDTPGHADFSEDTYRTLTAVDSALMVIDVAKGVEERTVKLMDICRLRNTPILTFINKLDREGKEAVALLDEIEQELAIECAPVTWPVGMGNRLLGIYHIPNDEIILYKKNTETPSAHVIKGLASEQAKHLLVEQYAPVVEEIELIKAACPSFSRQDYLTARQTPVFFGTALHNFGVAEMLHYLIEYAPAPVSRKTRQRTVLPDEDMFSGFVFKIQANMDPAHRDRIAFLRICSGVFKKGMRIRHVRLNKDIQVSQALTFMAGERAATEQAGPGDILGLHNHGTIQVGDSFSQGEVLKFTGIPHFAPELFRRVRLRDPMKSKALLKGLLQLGEEGAIQVFRPLSCNDLIVGAVGMLQFEVVIWRLQTEYKVDCSYEPVPVATVRWISCADAKQIQHFKARLADNIALDGGDYLTYLAPTSINLTLTMERWPEISFHATREHSGEIPP